MIYLTEEQVRERCGSGDECHLKHGEHLTPSAQEYLRGRNCRIVEDGAVNAPSAATPPPPQSSTVVSKEPSTEAVSSAVAAAVAACTTQESIKAESAPNSMNPQACSCSSQEFTYLDAQTRVSKSHPRIFFRGRLDTLIAETVIVQTSFAAAERIPDAIKNGLNDINMWIWQILQAEVSGNPMTDQTVCGMNAAVLKEVAIDPMTYLNQGHIMPDPALGPGVAMLNWLRARVREIEVAAVQVNLDRPDILKSLDDLSSALYVLMLLTVVAESGREIARVETSNCGKH